MIRTFRGVLRAGSASSKCVVTTDSDDVAYLSDHDIEPPLSDGEYDLEINGIHKRAVRANGQWSASDY